MNFTTQELHHILTALETMSNHDIARAREQITIGTTNHEQLKRKIKEYTLRLHR